MVTAVLQPLLRRGGVLHGPRLIFAILAVFILIFYFSSYGPSPNADYSQRLVGGSDPARGGNDIVQEFTEEQTKEKDDSLSDKFFDYLGHHKSPPKQLTSSTSSVEPISAPTSGASILTVPEDSICDGLAQAAQDILIVVDAPAPELYSTLSSRLLTHLRCAPISIFSTVSLNLGLHTVHDALQSISPAVREKHASAFNAYTEQHKAQEIFQDIAGVKTGTNELSKWTVLPALIESYKMHPEKKYFVLITPSTYISIPNLLAWLPHLSPSTPIYAGAQHVVENVEVAALSTGVLLSRAAMANLVTLYGERKLDWEEHAGKRSSPDVILGEALKEAGVSLTKAYPQFQGENLLNLPWNNATWCKAPIAWSSMTPVLMDLMWDFERNWTTEHKDLLMPPEPVPTSTTTTKGRFWKRTPATSVPTAPSSTPPEDAILVDEIGPMASTIPEYHYSHLLKAILAPIIQSANNRTDWDNHADSFSLTDKTKQSSYGHSDFDRCRYACDIRPVCVQFVFEHNKCTMGKSLRLGGPSEGKKSGWQPKRVKEFMKWLQCPKDDDNPFPIIAEYKGQPASLTAPSKVGNNKPAAEATAAAAVKEEMEVDDELVKEQKEKHGESTEEDDEKSKEVSEQQNRPAEEEESPESNEDEQPPRAESDDTDEETTEKR